MSIDAPIDVAWLILACLGALLVKSYLPGYIGEKAKNLATKEDVASITSKIEEVKAEYVKQIELYKSDIWKIQQQHLQAQEEAKLKIEVFKKAVVDVARITDLIGIYQIHISNSEMAAAISSLAFDKGNEALVKSSWDIHVEYNAKAAVLYTSFRELIVGLGGTFALLSIYFESELSDSLNKIIMMAHAAVELKMPSVEFRNRLESECGNGHDLNTAKENVGRYYDTLYDVKLITAESNQFFRLLRDHVKLARV